MTNAARLLEAEVTIMKRFIEFGER